MTDILIGALQIYVGTGLVLFAIALSPPCYKHFVAGMEKQTATMSIKNLNLTRSIWFAVMLVGIIIIAWPLIIIDALKQTINRL